MSNSSKSCGEWLKWGPQQDRERERACYTCAHCLCFHGPRPWFHALHEGAGLLSSLMAQVKSLFSYYLSLALEGWVLISPLHPSALTVEPKFRPGAADAGLSLAVESAESTPLSTSRHNNQPHEKIRRSQREDEQVGGSVELLEVRDGDDHQQTRHSSSQHVASHGFRPAPPCPCDDTGLGSAQASNPPARLHSSQCGPSWPPPVWGDGAWGWERKNETRGRERESRNEVPMGINQLQNIPRHNSQPHEKVRHSQREDERVGWSAELLEGRDGVHVNMNLTEATAHSCIKSPTRTSATLARGCRVNDTCHWATANRTHGKYCSHIRSFIPKTVKTFKS
ncbi:hypothetical protein AOLI_G00231260 [Acnodon oligacanthus]